MESRKDVKIDRWHSEEKGLFLTSRPSRSEIEPRIRNIER